MSVPNSQSIRPLILPPAPTPVTISSFSKSVSLKTALNLNIVSHLMAVLPWACYLTSLSFNFFYKMGGTTMCTSEFIHWGANEKWWGTAATHYYCVSTSSAMIGFWCCEEKRQVHSQGENLKLAESHLLTHQWLGRGGSVLGGDVSGGRSWAHSRSSGGTAVLTGNELRSLALLRIWGGGAGPPWWQHSYLVSLGESGACVAMVTWRS